MMYYVLTVFGQSINYFYCFQLPPFCTCRSRERVLKLRQTDTFTNAILKVRNRAVVSEIDNFPIQLSLLLIVFSLESHDI